jgi:hypothetical protein
VPIRSLIKVNLYFVRKINIPLAQITIENGLGQRPARIKRHLHARLLIVKVSNFQADIICRELGDIFNLPAKTFLEQDLTLIILFKRGSRGTRGNGCWSFTG